MRKNSVKTKNRGGSRKNKMLHKNRKQFAVVRSVDGYRVGRKIQRVGKCLNFVKVNVLNSDFGDLEGIGSERLILWKMTSKDMEELRQQIKQETLHKKRENIMPLTMQMSKDQIEKAYHSTRAQWNQPDGGITRQIPEILQNEHKHSELEEEIRNAEDIDERNLTEISLAETYCETLEVRGFETVEVVVSCDPTTLQSNPDPEELSCDASSVHDEVNQALPLLLESTGELPSHGDVSSKILITTVELDSIEHALDDSIQVDAENKLPESKPQPSEIQDSQNEIQHESSFASEVPDLCSENVEFHVADLKNEISEITVGSDSVSTLLHQTVNSGNSIQRQKRLRLDSNDLSCPNTEVANVSEEELSGHCIHRDLTTVTDDTEQQKGEQILTELPHQVLKTKPKCNDMFLEQRDGCDQLKIDDDHIGTCKIAKHLSVDLCRSPNFHQSCSNKRRTLRNTVRGPLVENNDRKLTVSKDRLVGSSSTFLLKSSVSCNYAVPHPTPTLKNNESYSRICIGDESYPANDADVCQLHGNSDPVDCKCLKSGMKSNNNQNANADSSSDTALQQSDKNPSVENQSFDDGSSQNVDGEKSDSQCLTNKPVSKPGPNLKIKLCEVDLFGHEKRKLSSSIPLKSDELEQNHDRVSVNKFHWNRVRPYKKCIGQKCFPAFPGTNQNRTKEFSRGVRKQVADNCKEREIDHPSSSVNCVLGDEPVENAVSNKCQDEIKIHDEFYQIFGTDIDSGTSSCHSGSSVLCADKPPSHLAVLTEFGENEEGLLLNKDRLTSIECDNQITNGCYSSVVSDSKCDVLNQDGIVLDLGDNSIIEMPKLDLSEQSSTNCGDTVLSMAETMPDADPLLDVLDLHCSDENLAVIFSATAERDCNDSELLPAVISCEADEGSETLDVFSENGLTHDETLSENLTLETNCVLEELDSEKVVPAGEPCHSCCDEVSELKNDIPQSNDISCECSSAVNEDDLFIAVSNYVESFNNESSDHEGEKCYIDKISPIHSPSPCLSDSGSSFYDDSGINEADKFELKRNPIVIPLTVEDRATLGLLECVRTVKIRMLTENDDGDSNC